MKKFKNLLNSKFHTPTWLFIVMLAVLLLRIPSFFEPYSYGDETIYLTLGEAVRHGVPLYKGIHDNKPPLLYVIAGVAGSLFWFKAILTIWCLVTIYIFWKLTQVMFPKKENAQKAATIIFSLLTTLPLLEGNIANAELFMMGPVIAAFYILLTKRGTFKNIFFAGTLFSIASLFKMPAAFELPAIIVFWFITNKVNKTNLKELVIKSFYLLLGFIIPIALTFVWFSLHGAFKEYLVAAYLQNFGYLSSWRPSDTTKPFLVKNFPLILRGLIVLAGFILLFIKRARLSKNYIFLTVWLLLALFAVTLSERPYPHYLLQSIPPFSLLLAIMFTSHTMEQVFVIFPLTLTLFVPLYFKFWHYSTIPYYARFLQLTTGQISRNDYLKSFGEEVPRNYKIAEFVLTSTEKNEKIFVWGDSAQIYALTRRFPPGKYVADYHIKDFSTEEELISTLEKDPPRLVIIHASSNAPASLKTYVKRNYIMIENIDGSQIWNLLNPKTQTLISK